jgi:ATP-dependent DNA helicase RecG
LDVSTPLQYVKGIGPVRAELLAGKGLLTVSDLLYYAPFRYEDRTNVKTVSQLAPGEKAAVLAQVSAAKLSGFRHGPRVLEATLEDGSGAKLQARWFHGERYLDSLVPDTRIALFGKVELDRANGHALMVQPEIEFLHAEEDEDEMLHTGRIIAVYEGIGEFSTRRIRGLIYRILKQVVRPDDAVPESVRERVGLPDLASAIRDLHVPPAHTDLRLLNEFRTPAQVRLIFDEFFWLECGLRLKKTKARKAPGLAFAVTERAREQMRKMLPFKPTQAQRRAMQEVADDMKRPHPMNRLLHGDVGSGKTIVAAQAAVIAIENGYQVAVLAPTEILATQHYWYFSRLVEKLGYITAPLTGSISPREKEKVKRLIEEGLVHIVIGTHALIQHDVKFAKLGLAIVDEQHRFGVRQRLELFKKGEEQHPDVLVMTATPIPRTLALTIYGDLDVSTIDELPPGRKPIVTKHVQESAVHGVYSFLQQEVNAGRQAYVVYPVVEETETAAVKAAEKMYDHLSREVFPKLRVGLLHGKMSSDDKDRAMRNFQSGETKVLVATTVIEVGVDVPNASVIVIEQAERFGLAQIHQLRGRVGRGSHQSYCILVTGKLNDVARERIRTLVESNDGFYIAEMDMRLRGPGEFFGTKQSGIPGLRLADLVRDGDVLEMARGEAEKLIKGSVVQGSEESKELPGVVRYIQEHWQRRYGLVQVG